MSDTNKWTTGLFDCCDDCSSCCMSLWCPCVAHGIIDNSVSGGGECSSCVCYFLLGNCSHCCLSPGARFNLRKKYGLMEAPCGGMVHSVVEMGLIRGPLMSGNL
jgi:Cys-rich protein (TIGR01571 family)